MKRLRAMQAGTLADASSSGAASASTSRGGTRPARGQQPAAEQPASKARKPAADSDEAPPAKRGRGRPRKARPEAGDAAGRGDESEPEGAEAPAGPAEPPLRKRGGRAPKPKLPFTPTVAGAEEERRPRRRGKKRQKRESAAGQEGEEEGGEGRMRAGRFRALVNRVRAQLQRIAAEQHMMSVYEADGWRGASKEKVKLSDSLAEAQATLLRAQAVIRECVKACDQPPGCTPIADEAYDEEGELDEKDILCSVCCVMESQEDNDIILCDGNCKCAYHERCLDPPLVAAELPEDEGWLCPACDAKVDMLDLVNEQFGTDYHLETPWHQVFADTGAVAPGAGGFSEDEGGAASPQAGRAQRAGSGTHAGWGSLLLGGDLPSSEEEDEDYETGGGEEEDLGSPRSAASGSETEDSEEEEEEEEKVTGAPGSGQRQRGRAKQPQGRRSAGGEAKGERGGRRRDARRAAAAAAAASSSDDDEDEVAEEEEEEQAEAARGAAGGRGGRRTQRVDYKALHVSLFGIPAYAGDSELESEDEDYQPGSQLGSPGMASP